MADVLTIGGVTKTMQAGSLRITEMLNGRSTASFDVVSMDGTYRPEPNDPVEISRDSAIIFAGFVFQPDEEGHRTISGSAIVTKVQCVDYNALPSRRQVAITLEAGTMKAQLTQLAAVLSPYGVVIDPGQADGASFDEMAFPYGPFDEILDKYSVATGLPWEVTYTATPAVDNLILRMLAPASNPAPFDLATGDRNVVGDIAPSPSLGDYANRIIFRFSEAARAAYAILSATANWADTETVEIGSKTYTFQATLTNADGNVQLGGTTQDSLNNLQRAITLGGTPGTDYAAAMTVHSQVTAYIASDGPLVATALQAGVSGNSIGVATNNPDAAWRVAGGAAVSAMQFGVDEALSNQVIAEDIPAQDGGANLVEKTIEDPKVFDESLAQTLADGYLVRALAIQTAFTYETRQIGIHPGMSQTVTIPERNLSGTALITGVTVYSMGHRILRSKVTAVMGLVIPESPLQMFKGWGGATGSVGISVVSTGGGSTGVGKVVLGGSDFADVPMDAVTPAYTDIRNCDPYVARSSYTALVRAWLWARNGGAVTMRLRNVTDSTTAGSASNTASAKPSSPQTFSAVIESGKEYRAQVIGAASDGVFAMSSLEAA